MKYIVNLYFTAILVGILSMLACNSGEPGNADSGDTMETQDSSQMSNYGQEHPNDRIHMQDSNAAKDSSVIGRADTTRTRDSAR